MDLGPSGPDLGLDLDLTWNLDLSFTIGQTLFSNVVIRRCQSLTEDVAAQCACWINQTIVIDRIKEFKCQAKSTQKLVTQHKVIPGTEIVLSFIY